MLNAFQQRIYEEVSASGLLEYEQAGLKNDRIGFPVVDGYVHVDIPDSKVKFAWSSSTAPNGAMNELDLRRAAAIASALADARDGRAIPRMGRVMA